MVLTQLYAICNDTNSGLREGKNKYTDPLLLSAALSSSLLGRVLGEQLDYFEPLLGAQSRRRGARRNLRNK
jgi:hypothetical protein